MCEKRAQWKRALFSQFSGCGTAFTSKQAAHDVVRALPCVSTEVGDEQIHGNNKFEQSYS